MIESASEDGTGIRFLMKDSGGDGGDKKWQIAPDKEVYLKVRNALRDKKERKHKKRPRSSDGDGDDDDEQDEYDERVLDDASIDVPNKSKHRE